MIWALAFALLFMVLGGDSPFVVPKLDNHVKEHVVDDNRKHIVLDLIKKSSKKRKEIVKKNKKLEKKLSKSFKSRETTQADFDKAIDEIIANQLESQELNMMVTRESQKNITQEEWIKIEADVAKDLEKTDKKRTKRSAKQEKVFNKLEDRVTKNIADAGKQKLALESIERLKQVYLKNYKIVQDELLNKESVMYQYKAPEEELKSLQDEFIKLAKEFFSTTTKTHFELVKLTTPEEWNKIY